MAQTISKVNLKKMKITNYDFIRNNIETGMLAFMSGNAEISTLIQKFTKSCWSHVGILFYIKEIGRVMLLESVESMGVRFIPFSHYVRNYDGEVVIAKINSLKNEEYLNEKLAEGIDLCLHKYDKKEILKIVQRIIKGKGKINQNESYICSELVEEVMRGIYKFKYNGKGFISPEDEWKDENVELMWKIR